MINIEFFRENGCFTGFECRGHALSAPHGQDIVCAAVSSACLMTANTGIEIMHLDAEAAADNGFLRFKVNSSPAEAQDIISGLHLHVTELEKQYPENIKVSITEV